MTHLIWQKSYNTGIHEIDAQHEEILSYVNQLDDARNLNNRANKKML